MPAVSVHLVPKGQTLQLERGTLLQDVLFDEGVEFPCGGRGRCKGCRIRVLEGALPVTREDQAVLSPEELAQGWRLACRARVDNSLRLELAQWEAPILADNSAFDFHPGEGLGVAVDLGTTTLVAQLIDLFSGNVLAVQSAFNAQARHGADIMSRIDFAAQGGQPVLQSLIREQLGNMLQALFAASNAPAGNLRQVVLAGNTVMHHLFGGVSVEPLSHVPFEPVQDGLLEFEARELGWPFPCPVRFLPCLGGFVGSDILAGILATRLHRSEQLAGLIDLGTNGEIVFGTRQQLRCASTAAGPAFEGARISMGMRAAHGAISEVSLSGGQLHCRVLGNGPPRGICGSGLVDAAAAGLELGSILSTGKMRSGTALSLAPPVAVTQKDIRELQLAKAAIAAGVRVLLQQNSAQLEDVTCLYLAGAFGNYINRASAQRIGLLPFPPEKVKPAGNTALLGAKLALFDHGADDACASIRQRVEHVCLDQDPQFQEIFVDEMQFPS